MSACAQSSPSFGWSDPYTSGLSGLGSGQDIAMQTVSTAGSILAGTAPLWAGTGTAVATGAGTATAVAGASLAIPIIGAAVAGVTLALVAIFSRKGPKQKIATTEMVEKLANAQGTGMMQQNLQAYMDGPRTKSSQAQALANFDAMWQWLLDNCGDPSMGDPGKACIADRQRGAKWDMAAGNRDPIANDPNVKPDPILGATGELIDSVTGQLFGTSSGGTGYLILAALLLAGVFFIGGGK